MFNLTRKSCFAWVKQPYYYFYGEGEQKDVFVTANQIAEQLNVKGFGDVPDLGNCSPKLKELLIEIAKTHPIVSSGGDEHDVSMKRCAQLLSVETGCAIQEIIEKEGVYFLPDAHIRTDIYDVHVLDSMMDTSFLTKRERAGKEVYYLFQLVMEYQSDRNFLNENFAGLTSETNIVVEYDPSVYADLGS